MSKSEANRPIVVTPGDPAGIGPDISISIAASDPHSSDCIFVCDPNVLADRAQTLSTECTIHVMTSITDRLQGALNVWPVTCAHRITPGVITAHSAPYVLACLEAAFDLCEGGNASAWVTGPVNKAAFNEAGIAFSGHTEWIAARAGISRVVMMLAAGSFRVALVTTHLPL
ncbi:MAG: 4-hydroxythreonine-4-phosphate dehydrogenase PdxA, partial [Gammaproteobacteria bacterium]